MSRIFWIHPQLRDYRLALFRQVSERHDVHFFFQIPSDQMPSDVAASLRQTVSAHPHLRRVAREDARHIWSGLAASDILITSFLWSPYSALAILIAKVHGKKVIVWEEQSLRFPGVRAALKRAAMRLLAQLTDAFFVLGEPQKRFLVGLGVVPDRIFVANEYPSVRFRDIPQTPVALPFDSDAPVVLFIGRLIEVKGTEYLLHAFAALEREHASAALVIVGDGPLREHLERLASELGITRIHFAGWVNDPREKSYLLARSAVVVVPSVVVPGGEAEGGPLVVLEALSAGRPVVGTTSLGSSTSFIVDRVNGFTVPERDAPALHEAMRKVLVDPVGFAQRARDHFDTIPGHDHQAATLERAFEWVTSARSRSS